SPTLGPGLHAGDRSWPEILQELIDRRITCRRSIQVINAGTQAYSLRDNVERVRRDILPLEPDLVISYHSANSLPLLDPALRPERVGPPPQRAQRASDLLGEVEYRVSLWLYNARRPLERFMASDDELHASELAALYDKLIRLGREHN